MLHWTDRGAVPTPTTVQIRLQQRYPGRVQAGAPTPSRSLSQDELLANIHWFTSSARGPRVTPCTRLVLAGVGIGARPDLGPALDTARSNGVTDVILHADASDLAALDLGELVGRVDRMVLPLRPESVGLALSRSGAARQEGVAVTLNLQLDTAALQADPACFAALTTQDLSGVDLVFTFPFPTGRLADDAVRPTDAVAGLQRILAALGSAADGARVKGLPACYLGSDAHRVGASGNRWYVDADHQTTAALLFFPDVVGFSRSDACRFCAVSARCDGFFEAWLRRSDCPPLVSLPE
jgi:hypothetical protein